MTLPTALPPAVMALTAFVVMVLVMLPVLAVVEVLDGGCER